MSANAFNFTGAANFSPPLLLEPSWLRQLSDEFSQSYMQSLFAFLNEERSRFVVFPAESNVFKAFWKTPFEDVKVVLLGQDPYHGPGQADGLCFSVPKGVALPPSLRNIFRELYEDLKINPSQHGCLDKWAEQGVLLLNTTLTVRQGQPLSHAKKGWERFTDAVIRKLVEKKNPPIFVLWGKSAQEKWLPFISRNDILCLVAAHPSPFSAYRGFLGCRHFSRINQLLINQGIFPINWSLSDESNSVEFK